MAPLQSKWNFRHSFDNQHRLFYVRRVLRHADLEVSLLQSVLCLVNLPGVL